MATEQCFQNAKPRKTGAEQDPKHLSRPDSGTLQFSERNFRGGSRPTDIGRWNVVLGLILWSGL